MSDRPVIFWFRDDLRLADNPGLAAALAMGTPIILLYVLDEDSKESRPLGGASKWWLDKSLRALDERIAAKGGKLILRKGRAETVLAELVNETNARAVYWNRRYGPARKIDERIKKALKANGVEAESFNGALLVEPFAMKTGAGGDYKVFTPFWKALQASLVIPEAAPEPREFKSFGKLKSEDIADWELHPSKPDWSVGMARVWTPGELGARKRLREFLKETITGYAEGRDRPDEDRTSRLSPHLRFGEISPHQIWRAASHAQEAGEAPARDIQKFLSEVAWRDFSHHLLYHDPQMGHLSWRRQFEDVDWRTGSKAELEAWRHGQTGYPIVDAGMRQLWTTGFMHNRVRMIVASFFAKDLLVHWRKGEEWFWDTLVDADEANNANGWQWTAGTGADAAPYFRVFNPMLQGEKFDPNGAYVSEWVPELSKLPAKWIHAPWDAPANVLAEAKVVLGETYPKPIIDHDFARKRALAAYKSSTQETSA
ncbi:MAG: deoxyribodipyrimidine photo-lyase [Hyphomonadaceae bacterium]|nr:deoxyribodipyrimidine photo-lyase [Hyphomonadaceae bacterium]